MIQTQLLRLDPPYQVIYAGGQLALHIATLIVTKEKDGSDYAIETHSHPVVSYWGKISEIGQDDPAMEGEFSGGVVRNQIELDKCQSVCRQDVGNISFDNFNFLVYDAIINQKMNHAPNTIGYELWKLGIKYDLPQKDKYCIELSSHPNLKEQFRTHIETSIDGDDLSFTVSREFTREQMVEALREQAQSWAMVLMREEKGLSPTISFFTHEADIQPIVDELGDVRIEVVADNEN